MSKKMNEIRKALAAKYDRLEAEQEKEPTDYREVEMEGIAWSITQIR